MSSEATTNERPSDEDFAAAQDYVDSALTPDETPVRVLRYFLSRPPVEVPEDVLAWATRQRDMLPTECTAYRVVEWILSLAPAPLPVPDLPKPKPQAVWEEGVDGRGNTTWWLCLGGDKDEPRPCGSIGHTLRGDVPAWRLNVVDAGGNESEEWFPEESLALAKLRVEHLLSSPQPRATWRIEEDDDGNTQHVLSSDDKDHASIMLKMRRNEPALWMFVLDPADDGSEYWFGPHNLAAAKRRAEELAGVVVEEEPAPQPAPVMTGPGVYRDNGGSGWRITDRDEEGWHTETGSARFANDGHEQKVRGWVLVERVADLSRPWPRNHDTQLLAHELAAWLASEPAPPTRPSTIEEAAKHLDSRLRGCPWFVSVGIAGDRLIVYSTSGKPAMDTTDIDGWPVDVVPCSRPVPAVEPAPQPAPVMTGPGVYRTGENCGWRIAGRDAGGWYAESPGGVRSDRRFADDGQSISWPMVTLTGRVADLSAWNLPSGCAALGWQLAAMLAAAEKAASKPASIVLPEPDECGDFNFPDGSRVDATWTARRPDGTRIGGTTKFISPELAAAALRDAGFGPGAGTTANGGA